MLMEIINARFDEDLVAKLDELVAKGVFASRSDALRKITKEYLDSHPHLILWGKAERLAKADLEDSKLERICAKLFSGKSTAAEIVGEGRDR